MTNYEMVSIMIILSEAIDGLDFNFVNLPNFNGKCLYCFKSHDGKIDFAYNPEEDNDVSKVFSKVLYMAQKQLLPREILDGETKDTVVGLMLNKIQAKYKAKIDKLAGNQDEDYNRRFARKYKQVFSCFEKLYETLNQTSNKANKNNFNLVKNFSGLCSSISRLDTPASDFYKTFKGTTDNHFADAIMEDTLPNWVTEPTTPISDSLNLARSRALTLAMIDNKNFVTAYGRSNLDNSAGVTIANRYGHLLNQNARSYFLHERRGKAGETFDLEKFIIEEGAKNTNIFPPEKLGEQRQAYYDYLAKNNSAKENLRSLIESYVDGDRNNANFLTDRIIMDTVILNLASICGYNVEGIFKVDPKLSKSSMSKMFKHNYELAKSNPGAVHRVVSFIQGMDYAEELKTRKQQEKQNKNKPYPNRAILFPITAVINDNEALVSSPKPDGSNELVRFSRKQIESFKKTHDLLNEYVRDENVVRLMQLEYLEDNYPELTEKSFMEEVESYKALIDMYEETERPLPRKRPAGRTSINCQAKETGDNYTIITQNGQVPPKFFTEYGLDKFKNLDNELVTDLFIHELLSRGNAQGIPSAKARIADYVDFLAQTQPKKPEQKPKSHRLEALSSTEFLKLISEILQDNPEQTDVSSDEPNIDYVSLTREGTELYADHIRENGQEVPKHLQNSENYVNITELERFKHLISRWHEFDEQTINTENFVKDYLNVLKEAVSQNNLNAGIIRALGLPHDKQFIEKYIKLIEDELRQEEHNQGK